MSVPNAYAPPLPIDSQSTQESDRDRLRRIARAQRHVNLAALAYLCLIPLNVALSGMSQGAPWAGIVLSIAVLGIVAFGAVSVYRLAAVLRGCLVAVLYAVGLFIPLLGLILLITLSQRATSVLKQHGIKVGFLGANPATV